MTLTGSTRFGGGVRRVCCSTTSTGCSLVLEKILPQLSQTLFTGGAVGGVGEEIGGGE